LVAAAAGAKQESSVTLSDRRLLSSMTYLAALGFDLAALGFAPSRLLSGLAMLSMTLRMN
jgi:hypothetical protein